MNERSRSYCLGFCLILRTSTIVFYYVCDEILQEQDNMFTILAGALTTGNIEFSTNDNNEATLQKVDALRSVSVSFIYKFICASNIIR